MSQNHNSLAQSSSLSAKNQLVKPVNFGTRTYAKSTVLRLLVGAVLWLALFALCVQSFSNSAALAGIYTGASLRYHTPISHAKAAAAREYAFKNAETALFWPTFWAEKETKFSSDLASTDAPAIWYSGNGASVASAKFLAGGYPGAADDKGCAISSNLSWLLWGSLDVLNQTLEIDGHSYYVRGIFENDKKASALISSAEKEFAEGWQVVELEGTAQNSQKTDATSFAQNSGLGTANTILLSGNILSVAKIFSFTPIIILLMLFAGQILKILRFRSKFAKEFTIFALLLVFALLLPQLLSTLPASFIPTRWSDFSFWKNLFNNTMEDLQQFFSMRASAKDVAAKLLLLAQSGIFFLQFVITMLLYTYIKPAAQPQFEKITE